ncbi:MAG: hypothetical protein K940chlam6_01203 [Chlamydiae bacterium]|nr:hypothetical protein [Chlamydiota bacterium]NGX46979.1 hypothetical protein [Chlamydiota bacterium]
MLMWIFSLFLLSHPLNFFSSPNPDKPESVEDEEEEEEDISYIPILDREGES